MELSFDINWLAVLVAGGATFMLGGLWYTALFGKLWQRLHGYSDEKMKEMQAKKPPPMFFGLMIVCYMVLAAVVAVIAATFNISSASGGATLGLLLWLGPAVCIGMTSWLASDRHIGIYGIDLLYQLIFLVMMGAIIGGWR